MADANPTTTEQRARDQSRPAVITAALLYLIAAYQRTPCPCVALCILRHLECLAAHEAADPVIRQISCAVRETWVAAAAGHQQAQPSAAGSETVLH